MTSLLAAFPVSTVFGGQVPIVNGVVGGVGSGSPPESRIKLANVQPAATTPGKLRVTENSGICETTSGVYQASGYGDLSSDESFFFWFFAARNH